MKNEVSGEIMKECFGLKPKIYSYKKDNDENKRLRVQKSV